MTYRTLGIVLRRRDVREADRLYTIFTKSHGKIEALTRGSRKMTSKLSPHLESFATVDLLIARGRLWDHVAGVEAVERFSNIGSKFLTTWAAFYAFELTDTLTKPGARDYGLWNLFLEYLRAVNGLPDGTSVFLLKQLVRAYACQLLLRLGVAPELERCQDCKGSPGENFELSSSGVFCKVCASAPRREQSLKISEDALKPLRAYYSNSLQSFLKNEVERSEIPSTGGTSEEAPSAVSFLLRAHLSTPLKAEKVFNFVN